MRWANTNSPLQHANIFDGPTFTNLTIEQVITAYATKAGTYPATAATGEMGWDADSYVIGDGDTSTPTFSAPRPTGGTRVDYTHTVWDGTNDFATIVSGAVGGGAGDVGVFAFEISNYAVVAGVPRSLMTAAGSDINIFMTSYQQNIEGVGTVTRNNSLLRLNFNTPAGVDVLNADLYEVTERFASTDRIRIAFSFDLSAGRFTYAINGVPQTLDGPDTTFVAGTFGDDATGVRFCCGTSGASSSSKWLGNLGLAYYDDRFVDLNTVDGLNELFTAGGGFRAFSDTGRAYYYGTAAELADVAGVNHGSAQKFVLTGSLTDASLPAEPPESTAVAQQLLAMGAR
jgi:hypothetical protein